MILCLPVTEDRGWNSPLSAHFGSAPLFLIVDTDSSACRALVNGNAHHDHGQCQPLGALAGENLDALVVSGIGRGALARLHAAGLRVFLAGGGTVETVLAELAAGELPLATLATACQGHGAGGH